MVQVDRGITTKGKRLWYWMLRHKNLSSTVGVLIILLAWGLQLLRSTETPIKVNGFPLSAVIRPDPMPYGAHPTLTATAPRGARCTATVETDGKDTPIRLSPVVVPSSGSAHWIWFEENAGRGGMATLDCTLGGKSAQASVSFIGPG